MLQAIVFDEAIETFTPGTGPLRCANSPAFLTAPVVLVGGIITRRGRGIMFKVTNARPLNMNALVEMQESLPEKLHEPIVIPNAGRSYPGTKLGAQLVPA